ncbi:MAG: 50S ribosomal protein L10 [Haloarculaceae archaeon]
MSAESERKTQSIPAWKREEVEDIVGMMGSYDSVGVVDIAGIPSRQLQEMRRDLHGEAELRVSRNTLIQRALDEEGIELLDEYVTGQVGLIGTDANPFGLFQQLEASKTSAPINAGEVAPNEIVIPAGDTGVDPGPFLGDLQNVGANARIDGGSIVVEDDSTVLAAGEDVSAMLANVLSELDIEPKEVGLDLRAVFADGVLFEPADLELDVEEYRRDVETGVARARNLALDARVPTAATMPSLLGKGSGEAKNLAIHASIEDESVMPDLIGKADAQVRVLAGLVEDEAALPAELRDLAPAAPADDEQTDDQNDAETEAEDSDEAEDADETEEAAETPDDEDDDSDGGEALGEMFG